jgi:hypothetical protein
MAAGCWLLLLITDRIIFRYHVICIKVFLDFMHIKLVPSSNAGLCIVQSQSQASPGNLELRQTKMQQKPEEHFGVPL